jgi:hypothetical protein
MKYTLIILLILIWAGPARSFDDICATTSPFVRSTSAQLDEFAEKHVVQRNFEGAGRVRDVKTGRIASKYTVIVDCGKNVLVEIPTSSPRVSTNLQIGEYINFSGMANGVYRRRYAETRINYLLVKFNDNSLIW